jgi:hypothetical protein
LKTRPTRNGRYLAQSGGTIALVGSLSGSRFESRWFQPISYGDDLTLAAMGELGIKNAAGGTRFVVPKQKAGFPLKRSK